MKKTRSLGTVEDIYGGVLRFKYPESGWKDLFITSKSTVYKGLHRVGI